MSMSEDTAGTNPEPNPQRCAKPNAVPQPESQTPQPPQAQSQRRHEHEYESQHEPNTKSEAKEGRKQTFLGVFERSGGTSRHPLDLGSCHRPQEPSPRRQDPLLRTVASNPYPLDTPGLPAH